MLNDEKHSAAANWNPRAEKILDLFSSTYKLLKCIRILEENQQTLLTDRKSMKSTPVFNLICVTIPSDALLYT